ncbi:MAG: thioredoxin-like domain-containing protein [Bacteroidota bacterium]
MRIMSFLILSLLLLACGPQEGGQTNAAATTAVPTAKRTFEATKTAASAETIVESTPPAEADIQVEVTGMTDGPTLLVGFFETEQFRADSAYIRGGKVRFQKKPGYEQGFYFLYFPNRATLQILLSDDQVFSMKTEASDLVFSTQVDGSIDNELLYQNLRFQSDLSPRFQEVSQQLQGLSPGTDAYNMVKEKQAQLGQERNTHLESLYAKAPNSLFTSFKRAGQNPDLRDITDASGNVDEAAQLVAYRYDFWENVNFADTRLARTPVIINKLKRYITELTPQNPDSIIASTDFLVSKVEGRYPYFFKYFTNWVALNYQPTQTTLMDAEAVSVHIIKTYFTNEKAFWADEATVQGLQQRASEMGNSLVNQKGPDVVSTDPRGKTRSIYEMKEPYIVVYMYNPECEHCQEETPVLKAYADQNKGKIGVFAIAIDTDNSKWTNYIQKVGMQNFVNVFDPSNRSIYAKYFVDKTPEMYVLNPERIIIGKNLRTDQVGEIIRRDEATR